jgi:hypothetical protein
MKYIRLFMLVLIAAACQNNPQQPAQIKEDKALASTGNYGKEFSVDQAVPAEKMQAAFTGADTVPMTISGNISASCKHTGCWMDLDMKNGETVHVTFKDESFTIPLDAAGKNAVAEGVAIRELIPVEKLQNYAREDGKSEEEIAAIKEPVYSYEFIANGVLIEE